MTDTAKKEEYKKVGDILGIVTPFEFYMAIKPGATSLQDLVCLDRYSEDGKKERIWTKITNIELFNPLLPKEAVHEVSSAGDKILETVLSLSKEMITAKVQIIGAEILDEDDERKGELIALNYPPNPGTPVYRPNSIDVQNILLGKIEDHRKLHIGSLRSRPEVDVFIDANPVVNRHLAILAMTGAGKSWTCRKILQGLIEKDYPIIIFDPHGDYAGLKEIYKEKVTIYMPTIHYDQENKDSSLSLIESFAYDFNEAQLDALDKAYDYITNDKYYSKKKSKAKEFCSENDINFNPGKNIWGIANVFESLIDAKELKLKDVNLTDFYPTDLVNANISTLRACMRRCRNAGSSINKMIEYNKRSYEKFKAELLPKEITNIIGKGKITIIGLAGYDITIQASMVSVILSSLFMERIKGNIKLPYLCIIEEAHNFAPGEGIESSGQQSSLMTLRRIATEGRKFGVGLILISQRPSRLNQTVASQCNSFIVMRTVNPADQAYVKNIVETLGKEDAALLQELQIGEALISGQIVRFPLLAKIKPPISRGLHEEEDLIKYILDI